MEKVASVINNPDVSNYKDRLLRTLGKPKTRGIWQIHFANCFMYSMFIEVSQFYLYFVQN